MNTENPTQPAAPELLSVADFNDQHAPPVNMRWALQQHYSEMVEAGAVLRFGRKILVDPPRFWSWLRERGQRDAFA
jgi:hypothetical protein